MVFISPTSEPFFLSAFNDVLRERRIIWCEADEARKLLQRVTKQFLPIGNDAFGNSTSLQKFGFNLFVRKQRRVDAQGAGADMFDLLNSHQLSQI